MIHAHVPTDRPKLKWEDVIKTDEDYDTIMSSGLAYVYFPDIPNWIEFKQYLKDKEKEVESNPS